MPPRKVDDEGWIRNFQEAIRASGCPPIEVLETRYVDILLDENSPPPDEKLWPVTMFIRESIYRLGVPMNWFHGDPLEYVWRSIPELRQETIDMMTVRLISKDALRIVNETGRPDALVKSRLLEDAGEIFSNLFETVKEQTGYNVVPTDVEYCLLLVRTVNNQGAVRITADVSICFPDGQRVVFAGAGILGKTE